MTINLIDIESTRKCGDCQLCCSLLPTHDVTPWNERCKHQRHGKGCKIYQDRPLACRLLTCAWLNGTDNEGLRRPDRAHYVVSTLPDMIQIRNDETGEIDSYPAIEIWIDPKFPDAHRDSGLRDYLERRAHDGFLAIVRRSPEDGLVLFAPSVNSTGIWLEEKGNCTGKNTDPRELIETLGLKLEVIEEETGEIEELNPGAALAHGEDSSGVRRG